MKILTVTIELHNPDKRFKCEQKIIDMYRNEISNEDLIKIQQKVGLYLKLLQEIECP